MLDYPLVLVQGVFGLVVFTMPGLALLSLVNRHKMPEWPLAFLLAASYALSSMLIAGLQYLSLTLLNPTASRLVAYLFVLATLLYILRTGWKRVRAGFASVGVWERCAIALLAAVGFSWLLMMPLSPYPSHLSVGLGDPPVYYRAATNLAAGRGWEADYFIGDYVGGAASYVAAQPILALVTSFLFQIFGTNWYSLYVYDAIAAAILIYLMVTFALLPPGTTTIGGRRILFLTVTLALVPTHFLLFGLGVVTAPGALVFLTAVAFVVANPAPAGLRYLIIVTSALFLFWVRPEASLLAVLLVVGYVGLKLLPTPRTHRGIRSVALVGCLLAAVFLWANIPVVVNAFQSRSTFAGLYIFYLRFDAASERLYTPWSDLNQQLSRANFSDEAAVPALSNPSIGSELRAHPVSFLRYLVDTLPNTALVFMRAISLPDVQSYRENLAWLGETTALAVLGTLLALAAIEARTRPLVVAIAGFFLLLPLLNPAADVRHVLTVSPAVIGLSLRGAARQRGARLGSIFAAFLGARSRVKAYLLLGLARYVFIVVAALAVLFLDSVALIRIRTDDANQSYVSILHDIEAVTSPGDVIASSYPQLITTVTGRKSIGTTWLTENIGPIVRKYEPDFILVDNARNGPPNYSLLEKGGLTIPGYVAVVHNRAESYVIFRSLRRLDLRAGATE